MEERRTEIQHASMEQATTRKLRGGDLQRRDHAEMPSTVAERPALRETEEMKFRVNKQRLYPRSAWMEYCHDSSLIINAKWV